MWWWWSWWSWCDGDNMQFIGLISTTKNKVDSDGDNMQFIPDSIWRERGTERHKWDWNEVIKQRERPLKPLKVEMYLYSYYMILFLVLVFVYYVFYYLCIRACVSGMHTGPSGKKIFCPARRLERWSDFWDDAMVIFFSECGKTIMFDGFSMVLPHLDHYHWM